MCDLKHRNMNARKHAVQCCLRLQTRQSSAYITPHWYPVAFGQTFPGHEISAHPLRLTSSLLSCERCKLATLQGRLLSGPLLMLPSKRQQQDAAANHTDPLGCGWNLLAVGLAQCTVL